MTHGEPGRAWHRRCSSHRAPSRPARGVSWANAPWCFRLLPASATFAAVPPHGRRAARLPPIPRLSLKGTRGLCRNYLPSWASGTSLLATGHPFTSWVAVPGSAPRIPSLISPLQPWIWCLSMLSPARTFYAGFSCLLPASFLFL